MNLQEIVDSINFQKPNSSVRWAKEDEMKQDCHCQRLSDPLAKCRGGLPIVSNGDTVYVDDGDVHSLIIGSTGSKKTRLFAMPMLELILRAGESVVVTDPKGELYDLMAGSFHKYGYSIRVINLREPQLSNGWNPFYLARQYYKTGNFDMSAQIINDFAQAMIDDAPGTKADPFWNQTARSMLRGLIGLIVEGTKYIPDEHVNLITLRHFAEGLFKDTFDDENSTFALLEHYPNDSIGRYNLETIKNAPDRTFECIRASYNAPMQQLYLRRSLVNMLSTNEIDFQEMGLRKSALFLIMPDEKTSMHKIVSLIIKQCYERLITTAQLKKNSSLPIRVNFLLDEFSNLPAIPDMPAMISAARSRNIRFHLIIQGLYQLSSKYGPDDAHTIEGNCGNWVFLTSRELPLLEQISNLCGVDSITGERLISVSQLQRLNKEKGEALMLIGRQYPYMAHMPDISQYVLTKNSKLSLPKSNCKAIHGLTVESVLDVIRRKGRLAISQKNEDTLVNDQEQLDEEMKERIARRFESLFGASSG